LGEILNNSEATRKIA
jgi:hypothetical protein